VINFIKWEKSSKISRERQKMAEIEAQEQPKERMTLWLDKSVKDELKKQAKETGVSVSAYVSFFVAQQKRDK
jgi:predicted HicB family RNase H-like nuclease